MNDTYCDTITPTSIGTNNLSGNSFKEIYEGIAHLPSASELPYIDAPPLISNVFKEINFSNVTLIDKSIQKQLLIFISLLSDVLNSRKDDIINNTKHIPAIKLSTEDEGSIMLEWAFYKFRFCFLFEINADKSFWYYTNDNNDVNDSKSGPIDTEKVNELNILISNLVDTALSAI